MAYLQQLQHGLADLAVYAASLQQLVLQPNRLPQIGIRLAQNVEQVQGHLHRGHFPLQVTRSRHHCKWLTKCEPECWCGFLDQLILR